MFRTVRQDDEAQGHEPQLEDPACSRRVEDRIQTVPACHRQLGVYDGVDGQRGQVPQKVSVVKYLRK